MSNRMRGLCRGGGTRCWTPWPAVPWPGAARYGERTRDSISPPAGTDRNDRDLARAAEERQIRLSFLSDYGGGEPLMFWVVSYPGIELARLPES